LSLALLCAFMAVRIWDPPPLQELRLRVFDFYQVLKPRESALRPVVIVDIDEASLRELGQWPWPRTLLADLVARLAAAGAAAIGFDIIFAEPDRMSPGLIAEGLRDVDEETRAKLKALPSNDQVFADAVKASRVVLGQVGSATPLPLSEEDAALMTGFGVRGPDPSRFLIAFPGLLRNLPEIEQAATGRGLFSIVPERDGIVRRVPMLMQAQGRLVPSLTLDMLRVVSGGNSVLVNADEAGVRSLRLRGFEMPTDAHGRLWVHFSHHDPARYVSAKDVLQGRVGADRVGRKLVLIGTSATGLLDIKTTPVDPAMPGVEVHAQVLENALTRSTLSAPSYAAVVELLVTLIVSLAIIWLAPILGAFTLLWVGAAVAAFLGGASWYRYWHDGLLLDATYPLMTSFTVYLALVFTNYVREQVGRRQIRSAFSQYLSPALVEQLAQSPEKLKLGGEERTLTVMFSDVRGFTTISESFKQDPQGLTSLMNRFLTPLTNAILARKGTIDKYMGDAIMAFWNAPLDDPSHQLNACEAALDMLAAIAHLNAVREREAHEAGSRFIPINVGVGLNTGVCVVGNMGSDLRFDYSLLGDPVNLASRLEGQSKTYGVRIVLGSATARAVAQRMAVIEIDLIMVKGKTEPEVIYALLGRDEAAQSAAFRQLHDLHDRMLALYRAQDWAGAAKALELCRAAGAAFDLDGLYDLYAERIKAFEEEPPPAGWTGVYAALTK
jgi:adenylate cyclase